MAFLPLVSQSCQLVVKKLMRKMLDREIESPSRTSAYFYSAPAALHRPVSTLATLTNKVDTTISLATDSKFREAANNLKRTEYTLGRLPYINPWYPTSHLRSDVPPDFSWLSESCGSKAAIGIFGGAVCGLLMGVFLGAMSDMTPPVTVINGKEVPTAPLKEQMRTTVRATGEKCIYWSRNFAFITGVFGGAECLVEKYRGKHDVWNSAIGGCVTGAALQAKQGPQAAAIGCGGFAVFSLVIDNVFPH